MYKLKIHGLEGLFSNDMTLIFRDKYNLSKLFVVTSHMVIVEVHETVHRTHV